MLKLNYEILKTRQRKERDSQPEGLKVRLHRALSWLNSAEQTEDADMQFVALWISFNAAYGVDSELDKGSTGEQYNQFISKVIDLDHEQLIYPLIWQQFTNSIRLILDNQYIYQPFWHHQNGQANFAHWEDSFKKAKIAAQKMLMGQDSAGLLSVVFSRLYTLRNQIIHGGASWNSSLNRSQINDANKLLMELMPTILKIMMDSPKEYWSPVSYPVQK
jgi:hypothetical protein